MSGRFLPASSRSTALLLALLVCVSLCFGLVATAQGQDAVPDTDQTGSVSSPLRIGGSSGQDDERDADIYPAIAFDQTSGRYLVVWASLRNAGSSSDGFDLYGRFLSRAGAPVGDEFRISDSNAVARSSLPAVVGGEGGFAVAWTARANPCQVYVQRVMDSSAVADRAISAGSLPQTSPALAYDPDRHSFVLAYAEGDDYMPPTIFGAATADCGNNASGVSRIMALDFAFNGQQVVASLPIVVAAANAGAFRPQLAFSDQLDQHIVVWEDRRNAAGDPARFDVYARRLNGDLAGLGSAWPVGVGDSYENLDASAVWTPRPAAAAAADGFFLAWYTHRIDDTAHIWGAKGVLLGPTSGGQSFQITRMTYAQEHPDRAPSGMLAAAYLPEANEFLLGSANHLESLWGYLSLALAQRVDRSGQLLRLDGSVRTQAGVGSSVDYSNDDQMGMSIAANSFGWAHRADFTMVYAKHLAGQPSQDFDIFVTRLSFPTEIGSAMFLPIAVRSQPGCLAESPHPYPNNFNRSWTIVNPDLGATRSRVHFRRLETESGYDYVYIYGASGYTRLTGYYPNGVWSNAVNGRTLTAQLYSDGSETAWGFCADAIETVR